MRRLVKAEWPRWITLADATGEDPAVRVKMAKISRSMKRRAQHEALESLPAIEGGTDRDPLELADAGDAYGASLIRQGLLEWEGIGDANGIVIPVTPESVGLFLDDDALFERLDDEYVMPEVLRDAEKNGLSVSPNGTGEAVTRAGATAISPATKPKTAAVSRTRKPKKRAVPTS